MATATAETTTAPQPQEGLWCGKHIPIIGVTGEFGSGKTLFGLTINPDCFSADRSQPPTTLHWDTEGSADTFTDALHFEHRPLGRLMAQKYPGGYNAIDLFQFWVQDMRALPLGIYRLGMLDCVSEVEDGLVAYVRTHPAEFGKTSGQYAKMEGLLWGDVKAFWKRILTETEARFETFVFASHMKAVWRGGTPIAGVRTAKGKETLWELASLYLKLDRTVKPGAKKAPDKPSGTIFQGKNRLVHFDPKSGELRPLLPPRLPEATPMAIREYIRNPPDYNALKPGERAISEEMTAEEKLSIQAGIAENNAVTATAELSRIELMKQAAAQQGAAMAGGAPATLTPAPVPVTPAATSNPANYSGHDTDGCSQTQIAEIRRLFSVCGATLEDAKAMLARRSCAAVADLSIPQAEALIVALEQKALGNHVDTSLQTLTTETPEGHPQGTPSGN